MVEAHPRKERGASLVEFALVVPLLLTLLFGMVDFGVRLSDQHALEDGVREAARAAAVGQLGGDTSCTTMGPSFSTSDTHELVCLTKERIGLDETDVRVRIVFGAGGAVEGEPILICVEFPADSVTGALPWLESSHIGSRSVMRLEADSQVSAYAEVSHSGGWAGCSL